MVHVHTFYPTPPDAKIIVTPDNAPNQPMIGVAGVDIHGNACQLVYFADGFANGSGVWLDVQAEGYVPLRMHGIVYLYDDGKAWSGYDIFVLTPMPKPEEVPPPFNPDDSNRTPQEIMHDIEADLTTPEGCGIYTEDSCTALHSEHSPWWGHILKNPGQHQHNGHAVDALMLLIASKGVEAGVYDIVKNSSSPEAEKSFNWVGPPDPNLWYYPETAYVMGLGKLLRVEGRRRAAP